MTWGGRAGRAGPAGTALGPATRRADQLWHLELIYNFIYNTIFMYVCVTSESGSVYFKHGIWVLMLSLINN